MHKVFIFGDDPGGYPEPSRLAAFYLRLVNVHAILGLAFVKAGRGRAEIEQLFLGVETTGDDFHPDVVGGYGIQENVQFDPDHLPDIDGGAKVRNLDILNGYFIPAGAYTVNPGGQLLVQFEIVLA